MRASASDLAQATDDAKDTGSEQRQCVTKLF
jgi:hypothetical protein